MSEGPEKCDSLTLCFYVVSLPGHSISRYISFSNYRWQYLYCFCLMILLLAWELFVGGIQKWEDNLEMRIKKLDLENSVFPKRSVLY